MILIADSGSTKTDWRLIDKKEKLTQYSTMGLNPYHLSEKQLLSEISKLQQNIETNKVEKIFFYGAGCSTDSKKNSISLALKEVFNKAQIEVEHDLLAAARATCLNTSGMVAILGTGANSCQFNGTEITENIPSLGYLLGDEGSGAYLGRTLLIEFLHNELPNELTIAFRKRFPEQLEQILDAIYKQNMPSRYLASFAPFLFHHKTHPYIQQMITDAFALFFKRYICNYSQHRTLPLHFVGSIAFYYNEILQKVAETNKITMGKIIEKPISGLVLFHTGK